MKCITSGSLSRSAKLSMWSCERGTSLNRPVTSVGDGEFDMQQRWGITRMRYCRWCWLQIHLNCEKSHYRHFKRAANSTSDWDWTQEEKEEVLQEVQEEKPVRLLSACWVCLIIAMDIYNVRLFQIWIDNCLLPVQPQYCGRSTEFWKAKFSHQSLSRYGLFLSQGSKWLGLQVNNQMGSV